MNVLVINNTTGIKYQDNVTPIQLRLLNENGTVYETEDKKVTAHFSNPYGFLLEKEVSERNESGNIIIRITKEEAEKIGLGKIYLEVVVSDEGEDKIFPGDGFIVFTIYKNAKTIGNSVTGITYEYFISKFDVLGKQLTKIATESLDLHQDTIDNARNAMETATWVHKQFESIVGKATDGPASLQLKFGYDGKEYGSPQARFLAEWELIAKKNQAQMFKVTNDEGYAKGIPSGTDLNAFYEGGYYKGLNITNAPSSGWYFYEIIRQGEKECLQIATNFGTKRQYIRYSSNTGDFNKWDEVTYRKDVQQMLDDQVKRYGLGSNPTNTVATGTNLNTLTDSGFYRLNGDSFVNQPESVGYSQMLVIRGGGDTVTQIIFKYNETKIWVRSGNPLLSGSGKWFDWYRPVTPDMLTSDRVNLTTDRNADVPGTEYPTGVTYNQIGGQTGYPGNYGTLMTIKYNGVRVMQYFMMSDANSNQLFIRNYRNDNTASNSVNGWTPWEKVGMQEGVDAIRTDLQNIGVITRAKESSNVNNITASGWYSYTTATVGAPSTTTGSGVLQHISYDSNSHVQIAYSVSMRVQWFRTKLINKEWTPWLQTAGSAADAKWEDLTPRGGSSAYSTDTLPQVLRLGDMVQIRGALKGITGRGFLALTLPGHCRPKKAYQFVQSISIGAGFTARYARWKVETNGDVILEYTSDNNFDATWFCVDSPPFSITLT
ncbi:pyocin knob domain-containing protein [Terribacillus saccharophilus]|uniref:pyocin knob domain-containing protein n=1 Tax=Terribacillus saccharophilus TaxID=361277 RepID=UPI000C9CBC2D|nr:pyocin knob domain-containing protein [Terribacillus goriensis]